MEKNILLIQPHSDDILFSCAKYLFEIDDYKSVTILTFEADEKRLAEDEKLKDFFPGLKIEHLNVDYIDKSHKEYFQQNARVSENAFQFLEAKMGEAKMVEFSSEYQKWVKMKQKILKDISVVSCLGVGHPFHYFVNYITLETADFFYREFPHSYKRRNQEQFLELTKSDFVLSHEFDDKELNKLKFDIASKVYKSQSGLLFYEHGYVKKLLPEQYFKAI
jgi:hypothetical protein